MSESEKERRRCGLASFPSLSYFVVICGGLVGDRPVVPKLRICKWCV